MKIPSGPTAGRLPQKGAKPAKGVSILLRVLRLFAAKVRSTSLGDDALFCGMAEHENKKAALRKGRLAERFRERTQGSS
jgi:hypothetical protein